MIDQWVYVCMLYLKWWEATYRNDLHGPDDTCLTNIPKNRQHFQLEVLPLLFFFFLYLGSLWTRPHGVHPYLLFFQCCFIYTLDLLDKGIKDDFNQLIYNPEKVPNVLINSITLGKAACGLDINSSMSSAYRTTLSSLNPIVIPV